MSIILGFDWGMKHIGVAVGQTLSHTARPLTSLIANQGFPSWPEVQVLMETWQPKALVVGIPLNMDGSEQTVTYQAKEFAKALAEFTKLTVHSVDERLSTWEAKEQLFKSEKKLNIKDPKTRKKLNALAATILLEDWLKQNII